jgi:hypothetical protein
MNLDVQFLTQYRGNTKQSEKVSDRFGWSTVEVDIEDRKCDEFQRVLLSGSQEAVYHDGQSFWVEADSANRYHRGDVGSLGDFSGYWPFKDIKGLKNFQGREQRRFFWNTFGLRFFDRSPAGHYFTLDPDNLKNYRPGTKIDWDETPIIGDRYADYLRENTVNVDGVIMVRIERPCFTVHKEGWRAVTIFTPFGGHGDPVLDYAALQQASCDQDYMRTTNWRWDISPAELEEMDRLVGDPIARSARAVFMDLFRQKSWLSEQETITKSKAARKVARLHEVWKSLGPSLDEGHLDDVVEVLLTIAEEGVVRSILESWMDRPIGF